MSAVVGRDSFPPSSCYLGFAIYGLVSFDIINILLMVLFSLALVIYTSYTGMLTESRFPNQGEMRRKIHPPVQSITFLNQEGPIL